MNPLPRVSVELSVLIPSSRPFAAVVPTLDALARQTLAAARYEVIVVFDGPDEGRAAALRGRRDPYALTSVPGPGHGRAAACNAGLAAARGPVVLFLDDDMMPRPETLAAHLARHAGAVPRAVMGAVPVHVPYAASFATRYIARRFARHMAKLAPAGATIGARDVYTGAFSIPRYLLQHLGGFDEAFQEYGNEDGELAGRLLRAGIPLVFAPEAVTVQAYTKTFAALAADNVAKGRSAVRFLELHPERSAESGLERIRRGSLRRRTLRSVLAYVARSATSRRRLIATTERLASAVELIHPELADRCTAIVLDACFQTGVWQAYRSAPAASSRRTVVHYTDSTALGGAERIALTILAGLDRTRWRPVLVVHDHPELNPLVEEARARGIQCCVERCVERKRAGASVLDVPRLMRMYRRLQPAVVHIHRAWARSGAAAILAAAIVRVPVRVTTEHLFLTTTPRRTLWLRRLIVDRLIHGHIAVSRAVAEALRVWLHVPADRITVVTNGVVPPVEPGAAAVRSVRRPLGIPDGARLVVVPAQLRRQKGHETLLDALPQLPGVVAAFAGEGPERASLATRAAAAGTADRVRFLGFREDLSTLLAASDVVVLPSTAEGLPLAVLEALALGRPVIASAVGGTPEAIQDGVNGLLVPPRDPHALAAAIRSLLGDPVRATRLGDAGRRCVRARFTAERMVRQTDALYEQLLTGTPSGAAVQPGGVVRSADWRYLTGRDRFARLAVFAAEPPSATGFVTAHAVSGDRTEGASCDGAFALDADDATLRAVRVTLRRGGVACLRYSAAPGRSPGSLIERAQRAGFTDARPYAPYPSLRDARAWVPLDDRSARSRVLNGVCFARTVRARAGRIRRRIWEARALNGFAGPVDVIASWGSASAESIENRVREVWADALGAAPPDRISWLLLTGGRESISKPVAIAVGAGTDGPGIVVKWPRTLRAGAGLAREAETLRALAGNAGELSHRIPRILFEQPTATGSALGQTLLPGVRLSCVLDSRSYAALAQAGADWLTRFAQDARQLQPAHGCSIASRDVIEPFLACVESAADPGVLRDGLALLELLRDLPVIPEHRDFAPWNVLVDGSALAVVDWESATLSGLPLLDLWYFLTHLALAVEQRRISALPDAYLDLTNPGRRTGRVVVETAERYVDALALPADTFPALRAATWMVHVPSEISRMIAATGSAVTPAQIRRAGFVRMWEAEVRRAAGARAGSRRM